LLGILSLTGMMNRPGIDAQGRWALGVARNMNVCIMLFCVAILVVRKTLPAQRKWITRVLNILLLISFPIGTAIAIYGLLKADKNADSS
jgi:Ca2+/Na+ antiporter